MKKQDVKVISYSQFLKNDSTVSKLASYFDSFL